MSPSSESNGAHHVIIGNNSIALEEVRKYLEAEGYKSTVRRLFVMIQNEYRFVDHYLY